MSSSQSRRTFFGRAAAAGGLLSSGRPAKAAPRKRPTVELLQVGVIAVGELSHMNSRGAIWAPSINITEPERWPVRTSRMIISHCWDSRPEAAREFAKRYQCEAVKNYHDMVDKVDGMIFAGLYECKWWPRLAKPYLEAGIPCFINRPFAMSMNAAREMIETAKKHNAPILSIDAHEDLKEGLLARQRVEELVRTQTPVFGADATTDAHEYSLHGVHGLYLLLSVFGMGVAQVSLQAPGWWNTKTPTSPAPMDWGVLALQYPGMEIAGAGKQAAPFLALVHMIPGNYGSRATLRVYYRGGWQDFDEYRLNERREVVNQRYHLQAKTVFNMAEFFETRRMMQSYEQIARKTQIYLAGFKSHIDHHGQMVRVDDVPAGWEAPSPYPDWIDESIFA